MFEVEAMTRFAMGTCISSWFNLPNMMKLAFPVWFSMVIFDLYLHYMEGVIFYNFSTSVMVKKEAQ